MIRAYQFTVGTTESQMVTVPPGPCTVIISVAGANTAYIGTGSGVTTSNGFPVPGGSQPVTIPGYPASRPVTLYAIASGASTPVGVLISTDA